MLNKSLPTFLNSYSIYDRISWMHNRIQLWHDDILYPKGQLYCYIMMLCKKKKKNLAIIQHHKSGTDGEIVAIFHIWSDKTNLLYQPWNCADCIDLDFCWVVNVHISSLVRIYGCLQQRSILKQCPIQPDWLFWYWASGYCRCSMR